jgi:hypothetical protein
MRDDESAGFIGQNFGRMGGGSASIARATRTEFAQEDWIRS